MKSRLLKATFLAGFFLLVSGISSFGQHIDGIWRGYFTDSYGEQYKLEFQIKRSNATAVKGVSYSYLDVRFYGKATMTGSFVVSGNNLRIREIKTVELRNISGNGACIMNYDLVYSRSGKEEFLEGSFLGKPEVKEKINPYKWGDCGGGKVFLRKVPTSDFYVEPFLKDNAKTPVPKETPVNPPVTKAPAKTAPPQTAPPAVKETPPPLRNTPATVKADTARTELPAVKAPSQLVIPRPEILKKRQNELMKVLVVNTPEVVVKLYDNGEIDDDTISVYFDNRLVLSKKRLSATALTINLKMEEDGEEHELIMVAENLGRIPPNTSLMIVESGDKQYRVQITSTEQKNAVVRFRYVKQ